MPMSASTIRLAVLDMAGTTVRDDGVVSAAFDAALDAVGVAGEGPERERAVAHVHATMGQSKLAVFRSLLGDEHRAQVAAAAFDDAYLARLAAGSIEPLPGAEATFDALAARGIRVCLTTGFSDAVRLAVLDVLGWRDRVDLSLSPGDGIRGRPAPDLVLVALMRLEIDAVWQVAVAGDTRADLEAGHAAGAAVIAGVGTGAHGLDELAAAPHTHLLDSVAELPAVLSRPPVEPSGRPARR